MMKYQLTHKDVGKSVEVFVLLSNGSGVLILSAAQAL